MIDGITIFGFKIYFYGIIIMLGVVAAGWLATREAKRRGINPDLVWDFIIWLVVAGIIGARIWHILTPPQSMVEQGITTAYYLKNPLAMLNIRNGGLGIPGAVMGGVIALYFLTRRYKQNFAIWTDMVAPGLALAQAIGRWGNFFNQEVYGSPTNLPWKLYIDPAHRLPEYADVAYYHPMFFYEFLYNLLNMALLLWLGRKYESKLNPGDVFLVYLIVYPVGRFLLEFLRLDPSPVAGFNANQTLMAVIAIAAAVSLVLRHKIVKKPGNVQA